MFILHKITGADCGGYEHFECQSRIYTRCPNVFITLSISRGHLSAHNSRKTSHSSPVIARYGVSSWAYSLLKGLTLWLLASVRQRVISNRDISKVYSTIHAVVVAANRKNRVMSPNFDAIFPNVPPQRFSLSPKHVIAERCRYNALNCLQNPTIDVPIA